ncbi:MAG: LamG domain-containing protein, partial [Ruminococcaceae bacterium]|nr:LamG domain-containing protein [Oscillospiraceae bacterium]
MKKLCTIFLVLFLTALLSVTAFAATGEELLQKAEMYLTFEDGLTDTAGNHTVESDGDTEYVEGRFGQAAAIRSGENALYTEDLKFGTESFTIACWVKMYDHESDPCLFANKDWGSGKNPGFLLSVRDNDWKYNANVDGGDRTDTEYLYSFAEVPAQNSDWYHLALVVDRAKETYNLYVNGRAPVGATSFAGKGHTDGVYDDEFSEYPFYIGEDGTGLYNMSKLLNFDIDEFAVFFSALSEEDVIAVYTYAPEGAEAAVLGEEKAEATLAEITSDPNEVLASADLYLSFDDETATDAKGHATRTEGEITFVDGPSGKAARIDADLGHIAVDDYKFGTDSFTVTTWINCESHVDDPCLFANKDWGSGGNPGWLLCWQGSAWKFNANVSGGERYDFSYPYVGVTIPDFSDVNQWYHLAVIVNREAETVSMYVNGRPYFLNSSFEAKGHTGVEYDTDFPFVIGEDGSEHYAKNSDSISAVTSYDEFAVFKRALTAEEVAAIYSLAATEEVPVAGAEPAGPTELLNKSWDNIFVNGEMMVNGGADGWLAENPIEGEVNELTARGWAYISTPITGFAYAIDGGDAVKSADYIVDRPDVKAAISEDAEGFEIAVDVSGLGDGAHTLNFYAIDANGDLIDTTFAIPFTKAAAESKGFADVNAAADGKTVITAYTFVDGSNGFNNEGADNLWDGDTATKFCTNEFPAESIVQLDAAYDITGFTMATANDNADYNGRS